jgi:hypothetical protein
MIIKLVKENGLHPTLSYVLEKCYTQMCFIDLFMRLLCDIYNACDDAQKTNMQDELEMFVSNFLTRQEFLVFELKLSSNYDEFCDTLLHRNVLIGQHKTIIALLTHFMTADHKEKYFVAIFDLFSNFCGNDEIYELLLDFILDFAKCDQGYAVRMRTYFQDDKTEWQQTSNKARYKIMDIIACR